MAEAAVVVVEEEELDRLPGEVVARVARGMGKRPQMNN